MHDSFFCCIYRSNEEEPFHQGVFWLKRDRSLVRTNERIVGDVILLDLHAKEVCRKGMSVVNGSVKKENLGDQNEGSGNRLDVIRLTKSSKSDVAVKPGLDGLKLSKRVIEIGRPIDAKSISTGRFFLAHADKATVDCVESWRKEQGPTHYGPSGLGAVDADDADADADAAAEALTTGSLADLVRKTAGKTVVRRRSLLGKTNRSFNVPWKDSSKRARSEATTNARRTVPLHSPLTPGALVLQKPSGPFDKSCTVAVVVDPGLPLRQHQRVGVQWLWDCVTGIRDPENTGAILADDMGLGKTLQCISLAWTMLRQGPLGLPVAKRVLVVSPSSLVGNWSAEIQKWLHPDRLGGGGGGSGKENSAPVRVYAVSGAETKEQASRDIGAWARDGEILLTSYDQLKIHVDAVAKVPVDLLLCDEGHRLKSSATQVFGAMDRIQCTSRVIMSGTPLQNNLDEFYALVSFVNPRALGPAASFSSLFQTPIMKSRERNASVRERELGAARRRELTKLTQGFILRRLNTVNEQYLPPRCDLIVCCPLTSEQAVIYEDLVQQVRDAKSTKPPAASLSSTSNVKRSKSKAVVAAAAAGRGGGGGGGKNTGGNGNADAKALSLISSLRKVCAHPSLVRTGSSKTSSKRSALRVEDSGKMTVLFSLLAACKAINDRVVVVSNFTSTLEVVRTLAEERNFPAFALDGSTPVQKRQEMVDRFNSGERFLFLLSSKAGGTGLNLIGANRLVLLDLDWNPANDGQVLARVWRQGQPKKCYLYRLISTGTMEETILQRQLTKISLASSVMAKRPDHEPDGGGGGGGALSSTKEPGPMDVDGDNDVDSSDDEQQQDGDDGADREVALSFSASEMRDLFTLHQGTISRTHDMLNCTCGAGKGAKVASVLRQSIRLDCLQSYKHHSDLSQVEEGALLHKVAPDRVSFVFSETRNEENAHKYQ